MTTLALNGGTPVRTKPMPLALTTDHLEVEAAVRVVESGLLSGFLGGPTEEFFGGPEVRSLEAAWNDRLDVKHSVSCNSGTSALLMAIGATGIGPGDEVIVSPYTFSPTAVPILLYGGIPVFADIEPDFFCLDPDRVRELITPRTKVIVTTDIHGQSSDMDPLMEIAKEYGLYVIVDCAQALGATYKGRNAGTMGHIGIHSLNRHKNIQVGEGGIAVTNDDELALRMQLIRNHGEVVVGNPGFTPSSLANMLGLNLRMTEVEAAIAKEQLKKLDGLNDHRIELATYLCDRLADIPGLSMPAVRDGSTHVYYMQVMLYDEQQTHVPREKFIAAVRAEGVPIWGGYVLPLYLNPMYQQRIAIGDKGFPFVGPHYDGILRYDKGTCPVAEEYFEGRTIINPFLFPPLQIEDMDDIADAIIKVMDNLEQIE